MTVQTKNRIGATGFALLLLGGAAYAAWTYWPVRGNIDQALKTDLTGYDAAKLQKFVMDLHLQGATMDQKIALFEKLKKCFESMSIADRLTLMNAGAKLYEENPNHPLVTNSKQVMEAFWHQQVREYIAADAAKRREMLDQRIDEQEAMETARRLKDLKDSVLGTPTEASRRPDPQKMMNYIAHAVQDGMQNGSAEDRASMGQYFMDLRQRRIDRGLPVMF